MGRVLPVKISRQALQSMMATAGNIEDLASRDLSPQAIPAESQLPQQMWLLIQAHGVVEVIIEGDVRSKLW